MEALEEQNAALRAENAAMQGELVTAHYNLVDADSAGRELYHEMEHLEREKHDAQQPVAEQPTED